MAMKVTLGEFLGKDEVGKPSPEVIMSKMALEVQADAFLQMRKLGMKQKDLAEAMGVSPAAISKMLSNDANLQLSSIARIASALECDVIPPRFVPIGEQPDVETSSTLSSGMTVTMTVTPRKSMSISDGRDGDDPIDDEYRELCAQAVRSDSVDASGKTEPAGISDLKIAGVAA